MDISHYNFNNYLKMERWSSYWHQINAILSLKPKSVLEIGKGDGVTGYYLKNVANLDYKSLDMDSNLRPDIIGNIENMELADDSYDLVCAFEVLEHLPFDKFSAVLSGMKRVAKEYVVISLPYWGRHFSLELRSPYLKKLSWNFKAGFMLKKHEFNGQHYWEIGKKGFSINKIKKEIEKSGLKIIKYYNLFESPYHELFILGKMR